MFGKLKEKLKSWTKGLSKKAESEEIIEKPKEIEIPKKYNVAAHKFEPDLEEIKEKVKEFEEDKEIHEQEETETISEIIKEKDFLSEIIKSKKSEERSEEQIGEARGREGEKALEQEPKEKKSFFKKITSKITKVKISEEDFDVYAEELEMLQRFLL